MEPLLHDRILQRGLQTCIHPDTAVKQPTCHLWDAHICLILRGTCPLPNAGVYILGHDCAVRRTSCAGCEEMYQSVLSGARHRSVARAGGDRQDLAQIRLEPGSRVVPLPGITERYLFETHAVDVLAAAHVQVAIDDGAGPKPHMPVVGALRSAPDREARDSRQ